MFLCSSFRPQQIASQPSFQKTRQPRNASFGNRQLLAIPSFPSTNRIFIFRIYHPPDYCFVLAECLVPFPWVLRITFVNCFVPSNRRPSILCHCQPSSNLLKRDRVTAFQISFGDGRTHLRVNGKKDITA